MSTGASPLLTMTQSTPTALWNDSADPRELAQSIAWGAVGATCNPVIAVSCIKADLPRWTARMREIAGERPTATEAQIGWQVVEEISVEAACKGRASSWTIGSRHTTLRRSPGWGWTVASSWPASASMTPRRWRP